MSDGLLAQLMRESDPARSLSALRPAYPDWATVRGVRHLSDGPAPYCHGIARHASTNTNPAVSVGLWSFSGGNVAVRRVALDARWRQRGRANANRRSLTDVGYKTDFRTACGATEGIV